MPVKIPWLQKKKEREQEEQSTIAQREQNSVEENELLDLAQERFRIARNKKVDADGKSLHEKWRRIDNIYRGKQWLEEVPEGKSAPVINYIMSLVEAIIPRMTDHKPEIAVYPRTDPHGTELAKMLGNIHDYLWYTNSMETKLPEAVRLCCKYGTSILKVIWDTEALNELGEVAYSVIHPMNFFPDPRGYEMDQLEYCFTSFPRSLEYISYRWPDKCQYVNPDSDYVDTEITGTLSSASQEETATVKEYWFFDEYRNLCVMYFTQDLVLEVKGGVYSDSKNPKPFYAHNSLPFNKFVDYPADKAFWGVGEVELVEMIQRLINSFEAQIIDNTRLMANNMWVVNKTLSGLQEEDTWMLDNNPGSVLFTHNGGVDKVPGTPIPGHVQKHQDSLVLAMEQVLGIHDVVQGRTPSGGVRAASAIIALQESANIKVKQKSNNMSKAIESMARLANWLILENYDEPRSVRVAGTSIPTTLNVRESLDKRMVDRAVKAGLHEQETQPPMPMPMEDPMMGMQPDMGMPMDMDMDEEMMGMEDMMPQEMMPQGMQPAADAPFLPHLEEGAQPEDLTEEEMDVIYEYIAFPEFDIEVKVGPSVPYSQALLYEEAKELFQLGAIDQQALLEATNFPGKEEILQRMTASQQPEQQGQGERIGERTY